MIKNDLPKGWRFCFENVFAKHSIHYKNLKDYHYLLSVWNEYNTCLSWDETKEWSDLLEVPTPEILYRGVYDEKILKNLYRPISNNGDECEGYVIRPTDSFPYRDFRRFNLKFVRENHVQTSEHWKQSKIIENEIKCKIQ